MKRDFQLSMTDQFLTIMLAFQWYYLYTDYIWIILQLFLTFHYTQLRSENITQCPFLQSVDSQHRYLWWVLFKFLWNVYSWSIYIPCCWDSSISPDCTLLQALKKIAVDKSLFNVISHVVRLRPVSSRPFGSFKALFTAASSVCLLNTRALCWAMKPLLLQNERCRVVWTRFYWNGTTIFTIF